MNLRPSGYEPDELPDCSTPRYGCFMYCIIYALFYELGIKKPLSLRIAVILGFVFDIVNEFVVPVSFRFLYNVLRRTGDDLLFRALRRSTIGTISFHFQVRDGAGWDTNVITTSSSKNIILF